MSQTCYMCTEPAVTDEHVPPRAFFPRARRHNLWTVPSCRAHNNDNSADVEYVRNAVSTQAGTNAAAEEAFDVARRSWGYSPALFARTFREFRVGHVDGAEAGVFPFDLARVERVMDAVAHGLAYRDFGSLYVGAWRVFCATLRSERPAPHWDAFRQMLNGATYEPAPVPVPDVFRYGICRMDQGVIYQLVFYGGFVVYAWPVLEQ